MAEPVARPRRSVAPAGLPAYPAEYSGGDYRVVPDPETRAYADQLTVQERAVIDDLVRRYNVYQVLTLDLPEAWKAYARWANAQADLDRRQGRKSHDRTGVVDQLTERWLSAFRQLILHQLPGRIRREGRLADGHGLEPARQPRIEEAEGSEQDAADELLALAERLAQEAETLALTYPSESPERLDVLEVANYLRTDAVGDRERPATESWFGSLWRFIRSRSRSAIAPLPEGGVHVRLQLVNDKDEPIDELMTVECAAVYLGVTRGRVSQLLNDGTLVKFPLNERCNLVAKQDLDRYLESSRRQSSRSRSG